MGNYLTYEGLSTLLTKLKEKFSLKDHKHNTSDINGLAAVAKTGNYNDLTNKPSATQSVSVATSSNAGIVKPSSGLSVDGSGGLSVNVDTSSGLRISNNNLSLDLSNYLFQYENKYCSWIEISEGGWRGIYDKLVRVANACNSKRMYGICVMVKNISKDNASPFYIVMTQNVVSNLLQNTTRGYITSIIGGFAGQLAVSGCCEPSEIIEYETIKLLSTDPTVDAVGLFAFYKLINTTMPDMMRQIGRVATDVVSVVEYNRERLRVLGFEFSSSNVQTTGFTYILFGEKYVPLYNMINRFNTHVENSN